MIAPVLLLALLAACGRPAAIREPAPQPAPWCFALTADREGVQHYGRVCADASGLCEYARDRAIAFAGLAHFGSIGACHVGAP